MPFVREQANSTRFRSNDRLGFASVVTGCYRRGCPRLPQRLAQWANSVGCQLDRRQIFYGRSFTNLTCGSAFSSRGADADGWAHKDSNLGPTDYESAALIRLSYGPARVQLNT